jgi:uncharacterized protein (TIGR02246 family)
VDAASHAFDDAQQRKDAEAIARFLTGDFRYVNGSGKLAGRDAFMAAFSDSQVQFDPFVIKDRSIISLGPDAAIVAAEATISGMDNGKRFSEHFRYADTFQRREGKWKVVYVQVTRIMAHEAAGS